MRAPKTVAHFVCGNCGHRNAINVALAEYDPASLLCDRCGHATWIGLEDLRTATGERLISYRPFVRDEDAGSEA